MADKIEPLDLANIDGYMNYTLDTNTWQRMYIILAVIEEKINEIIEVING